jgi:hypothetical protein
MKEFTIPQDAADRIAIAVLEEHLSYLRQDLKSHREQGTWMHPEDVRKSEEELIPALKTLIRYFGGEV